MSGGNSSDWDEGRIWLNITANWGPLEKNKPGFIHYVILKHGINDEFRGLVWTALTRSTSQKLQNPGAFSKLCLNKSVAHEDIIARDIKRTFSKHKFFDEPCAQGQLELFQVLRAYAAFDKEVGYCQGMGFIAAVLLLYLPQEDAFWVLVSVMQRPEFAMRELFKPNMPRLKPLLENLAKHIEIVLPRLHSHFVRIGLEPGMYASQWFLTLFSYNVPLRITGRIWDIFFAQGWTIVLRVALTILENAQAALLELVFEQAMMHLRDITMEATDILPRALEMELPNLNP